MTPDQLKAWRKSHNYKAETAAAMFGVTLSAYQKWEVGKHKMHPTVSIVIEQRHKLQKLLNLLHKNNISFCEANYY